MYKEYSELYNKYTAIYGNKTAIFLMVGSFYELYDIQNIKTGECRFNVKEITDHLGIQLAIKKKDIDDNHDGLFAGFPDYAMHKWAGRLTVNGWTVVIVDQLKDNKGKVIERKVSRILSPSTHIELMPATETPYVATIFFKQGAIAPTFGVAILDLTTGITSTYSGQACGNVDIWTADDLVQMLCVFQPKELIIYWLQSVYPVSYDTIYFRRMFGIQQNIPIHLHVITSIGAFSKELVRKEYLEKVYSSKSLLPIRQYLGLRSECDENALLYLLQFVEDHIPSALKLFQRNQPWSQQTKLICGNHALSQLQMVSPNINDSVLALFNVSQTAMGKRAIKERLLSPLSSAQEIKHRLSEVTEYIAWPEEKKQQFEKSLRFISDIQRLHRKILCGTISSQEIANIFQSYMAIYNIQLITDNTLLVKPFTEDAWIQYQNEFKTHFNEEKALQASEDITPFNIDTYTQVRVVENEIKNILEDFEELRKELSNYIGNSGALRLESRDKEPYRISGSKANMLALGKVNNEKKLNLQITMLKSGGWLDSSVLQQLNIKLTKKREQLNSLYRENILIACDAISKAGEHIWSILEQWISHIDCTQCIANVSLKNGYSCPSICDSETDSYVDIKGIRHPLVESLASRVAYVQHDVHLGGTQISVQNDIWTQDASSSETGGVQTPLGWLVYGMNASGKSTLMKATGLCVLLAQAGCFVPARSMTLAPFKSIYTRILNQDNLFAGLSSFAVEMSELRDIITHADKYTLILGDELCAGTESISAQALVGAGIQWLSQKQAKFIFATHLHGIPKMIDLGVLNVAVWHLHVDYNPVTKKLIYDRSLRKGSGSTLYGLEVARAMSLPTEFIEQALKNRHKIIGSTRLEEATQSSWNTNIVRQMCEICKSYVKNALEVHHIQERSTAKNNILPDGTHMNNERNLIVLCETCHDKHHRNDLEIGSVLITSEGNERIIKDKSSIDSVTESIADKKKKIKWSEEDMEEIHEILKKFPKMALKSIRYHLESKHNIKISETVLSKIRVSL